jgi:hypothetical protein
LGENKVKKLKLIKVISSLLIAVSLLALNPIGASAEWRQNRTGWWYAEGSSYAIGWKLIDGKYYYFSNNGYMMHDTYIDGYELSSDGAWVVTTPTASTTTNTTTFDVQQLQIISGLYTTKSLLSCKNDGTVVDLWDTDDQSGRQRWQFIPVNGIECVYNIRVFNGVNSNRTYLSSNYDGSKVDLWSEDDGSGRQRWRITNIPHTATNLIQVYNGVSSNRKYLSCSSDGSKVDLWSEDDGSGRQRWVRRSDWNR